KRPLTSFVHRLSLLPTSGLLSFLSCRAATRVLHSFPTRRSSDLRRRPLRRRDLECKRGELRCISYVAHTLLARRAPTSSRRGSCYTADTGGLAWYVHRRGKRKERTSRDSGLVSHPVRYSSHSRLVFNTHWHPHQTGSNGAFGRAGATLVAHAKTRHRLAVGYYVPHEDRYEPPMPADAVPTETFHDRGERLVDGERIEYGYLLEAHTDGDIYVYFRDSNVIAVGDALSPARDPEIDWFGGGWLGGRVDALALLLGLVDDETVIVPGYGPPARKADIEAEHRLMQTL